MITKMQLKDSIGNPKDIRIPLITEELKTLETIGKTYLMVYNLALDK